MLLDMALTSLLGFTLGVTPLLPILLVVLLLLLL
jgi:hypothetical protein